MNKRGQFNLIGLSILAVITVVIIALFYFSSTFRFITLGAGLMIMSFVVLLGNGIKNYRAKVGIFIALLGIGFVLIFASGVLQNISLGERYVEVPYFATIECKRGLTNSFPTAIPTDGQWFYKGQDLPENTDSWNLKIKTPDEGLLGTGKRVEYYICNSKSFCSNRITEEVDRRGDIVNLGNIDADKFVWVQYQSVSAIPFKGWIGRGDAELEVTYQAFNLIRDDILRGGRQEVSNTVGCTVPISDIAWSRRITSFSGSSNIDTFSGDNKLEVGEVINYISGDILAVSEGNIQNGGWCIYENGIANIYEIESITYGYSNKIKRVNLDNRIRTTECCDGEVYPNNKICEDGKFKVIEEAECSSRRDCGTLEFFETSSNTIGRYDCINSKCEIVDERLVECTKDSQCKTNEKCSRNTFTCELSSEVGGEGDETQDSCSTNNDCESGEICSSEGVCIKEEIVCEWYEQEYSRDVKVWKWYNYATAGLIPPETQVETGCRTAGWVQWSIIGIVIISLGSVAIIVTKPKRKKK